MDEKKAITTKQPDRPTCLDQWLPSTLVRIVSQYAGILFVSPPFVSMWGNSMDGQGKYCEQKCDLDVKTIANGNTKMIMKCFRTVKPFGGRRKQLKFIVSLRVQLLDTNPKDVKLDLQLSHEKSRVRTLESPNKTPWFIKGVFDMNPACKLVIKLDLASHTPCRECGEYFSSATMGEHRKECEVPRECKVCHMKASTFKFRRHLRHYWVCDVASCTTCVCPGAMSSCSHCKASYLLRDLQSHVDKCVKSGLTHEYQGQRMTRDEWTRRIDADRNEIARQAIACAIA